MAASYNTYLVQSLPTTGIDTTGLYLLYEEDGSIIKSYKRNPANTAWWFMGQYIGTAGVNNIPGANITLDIEEEDGEIWISGSSKKVDITSFVTGGTDLGITGTTGDRTITSSTGTNATIPVATGSQSGVMSAAQAGKLDGIQAGAQVN